ncbi:hypothetical protein HK099_006498 [Clydaea vesicula]|uniref:Uncharacterized protein n=1 Tax=Clydaea vesicula TaxID=447962 RepID=A0AAD5XU86_9FUNG|nr:hypothetical protein HK099_006498 [Clydaea vesicula]
MVSEKPFARSEALGSHNIQIRKTLINFRQNNIPNVFQEQRLTLLQYRPQIQMQFEKDISGGSIKLDFYTMYTGDIQFKMLIEFKYLYLINASVSENLRSVILSGDNNRVNEDRGVDWVPIIHRTNIRR